MKDRNEIMRFFGLHPQNDVRRRFAFTLAEGATHVDNSNNKRRFAFTLAEVLITLGIIGVVAALTIPNLIQEYQKKQWVAGLQRGYATLNQVFKTAMAEDMVDDVTQTELYNAIPIDDEGFRRIHLGSSDYSQFVEQLKKYLKITKVCDKDHTMQCFEKTTTVNDKEVDMSAIVDASGFGQDDWGTNVMGIQFANGVTGLIAYNPKCTADPHNNQINGSDCFAMVYDTSGFSNPNEMGKDFNQLGSVLRIGPADCVVELDGVCFTTQAFSPTPINKAECEAIKDSLGIVGCHYDNDYWAGAVKQCGGIANMPTAEHIAAMRRDIFNDSNDDWAPPIPEKLLKYGLEEGYLRFWSNAAGEYDAEIGASLALSHDFGAVTGEKNGESVSFDYWEYKDHAGMYAICVK